MENTQIEIVVTSTISAPSLSATHGYWVKSHYISRGNTGHWSKYGGAIADVIKEDIDEYWFCQSCSVKQPHDLTPYLFQYENEFLRVCASCLANECAILIARLQTS